MDSSSEFDSPNTVDKRRFGVVGGRVTQEERDFCIRNGLLELGEDGEYYERSTMMDSVLDASTDDEDDENVEPAAAEIQDADSVPVSKPVDKSKSRLARKVSFNCTADSSLETSNHSMQLRSACRKNENITTTIHTPSRILSLSGANSQSPVVLHFSKYSKNGAPEAALATPEGPLVPTMEATTLVPAASTPVVSKIHHPAPPALLETTVGGDHQSISAIQCPTTFCSPLNLETDSPVPGIPNREESLSSLRIPALFQTPPSSTKKLNATVDFIDLSYTDVADQIANAVNDSGLVSEIASKDEANSPSTKMILRDFSVDSIEDNFETPPPAETEEAENLKDGFEIEIEEGSRHVEGIKEDADDVLVETAPSETPTISVSVDVKCDDDDNILIMEDIEEIISEASNSVVVAVKVAHIAQESAKPDEITHEISEISDVATDGSAWAEVPQREVFPDIRSLDLDEYIREEYAVSPETSASNVKGIDAISPSCVAEDISLNDTADSLVDLSLDDISNGSFSLDDPKDDIAAGGENHGDSFRTCPSQASTYATCDGEEFQRADLSFSGSSRNGNSSRKSFEDLDDTITLMEKLLKQADQLEEQEMQESVVEHDMLNNHDFEEIPLTPQKQRLPSTPVSEQYANSTDSPGFPSILPSPSLFGTSEKSPAKSYKDTIFATPAGPAPKAKPAASPMDYYFKASPSPKSKGQSPATATTTTTRVTRNSPSPVKGKPILLSSPSVSSPSKPQTMPKIKLTPKRLKSILDSPGSRVVQSPTVPSVPVKKLNSPRGLKTPTVKTGASGLPILSPVANYIHALPTPTQIRRIHPPKYQPPPPPPSPRWAVPGKQHTQPETLNDSELNESRSSDARMPRPKSSLPVPMGHLGDHKLGQYFRGKESLGSTGVTPKKVKELATKFYVGPDQVKPVSGSLATPDFGSSKSREITPISHRHLGKRDSNNASMVNQEAVTRKFCPERFGFQSHK